MNFRTLLTFALFLTLAAAGLNSAAAQAAASVPARPSASPRVSGPASVPAAPPQVPNKMPTPGRPVQPTVSGNPSNQVANEAAQTKVVRIYRGEGYFDIALADKLRRTLTSNKSADQKAPVEAGRP